MMGPNGGYSMYVIGLDLSMKTTHHAVSMKGPGEVIDSRKVTSTQQDLKQLLETVQRQSPEDESIHVIMEASGWAWYLPAHFFASHGCKVYKIQAQRASAFREYMSKYTKTDPIDAECLARLRFVEPESLDDIHFRDSDHFGLKQCLKQREDFQEDLTRYRNRLRDLLDGMIPQAHGLSNRLVTKKKFREVIPKLFDLSWVKNMGRTRFHNYVRRRDADLSEETLDTLFDACMQALQLHRDDHVNCEQLHDQAQRYLDSMKFAEEKIDDLENTIEDFVQTVDHDQSLRSVYGVGLVGAAYMEAYLSPIKRFDNLNKIQAWLGWIPKTLNSGQLESKGLEMSKAGPAGVRKQLYVAADTARQYDPQIAQCYYRQMVEKGNPHTKALIAAGSKLLARIVRVLRTRQPYELRDTDGQPVKPKQARALIQDKWTVPQDVRQRLRKKKAS